MEIIHDYIRNNEIYDISNYLESLSSDPDEYMNCFGETVELMMELNSDSPMVDHIMESWDLDENNLDNTFIMALKSFVCSSEELKFLVDKSRSLSGMRFMITKIIDMKTFGQLINVLSYAYGDKLTFNEYCDLKEYLIDNENLSSSDLKHIYGFIEDKLNSKQEKPSWVSLKNDENIGLLSTVAVGMDLESVNEILENLKREVNNFDIDEDSMNLFSSTISDTISFNEPDIKLNEMARGQSYDKSFRVWGPENRFSDRECIGNLNTKGGCRMLLCTCHEDEYEWFTGSCDNCRKKIVNISFALRYPKEIGGWVGCYCSFNCISENMGGNENLKLKNMKENIISLGIMDRSV